MGGYSVEDLYPPAGAPPGSAEVRRVARTVVHPGYGGAASEAPNNDIALVFLEAPSSKTPIRTPGFVGAPPPLAAPPRLLDRQLQAGGRAPAAAGTAGWKEEGGRAHPALPC